MGLVEFGAGWALGAKAGETHFDEVVEAGKGVLHSQEVADLVHALRSHVGYSLKALGGVVMGDEERAGRRRHPRHRAAPDPAPGRRRPGRAAPAAAGRAGHVPGATRRRLKPASRRSAGRSAGGVATAAGRDRRRWPGPGTGRPGAGRRRRRRRRRPGRAWAARTAWATGRTPALWPGAGAGTAGGAGATGAGQ